MAIEELSIKELIGTNNGHGHVWARPDRMKVRCGGHTICKQCALDRAKLDEWLKSK